MFGIRILKMLFLGIFNFTVGILGRLWNRELLLALGPGIFVKTRIKEVTPRPITAEERKYLEKNFMVNISDPEGRQRNQNPPTTTGSCCSPTHHITSQPMVAQSQNHVGGEQVTYVQQQTSNQYQQVHSSNKNPGTN